jgi:hypothetical protein
MRLGLFFIVFGLAGVVLAPFVGAIVYLAVGRPGRRV